MLHIYTAADFSAISGSFGFDPAQLLADHPSAHLILQEGDAISAHCSVWWQGTPMVEQGRCGTIGHFAAADEQSGAQVIEAACMLLRQNGCVLALAPMNGNTWRSYRYATGGLGRPPFLLEPPPAMKKDRFLLQAGFAPVSCYASYIEPLAGGVTAQAAEQVIRQKGFDIRNLDTANLRDELDLIYDLAVIAFRENPYYTDLPREAFIRQYLEFENLLIPCYILLAFRGETLAGFLFCLPDYREDRDHPRTLLLKTIAVLPAFRSIGLASSMMSLAKRRAHENGFTHGVGALVYRGNQSEKLCSAGTTLREYTLFGRNL